MFKSAAAFVATALLASSALAMEFTNPQSGTTWGYSEQETITWTAPSSDDPARVSLLIANLHDPLGYLPYYGTPLALDIPSSQGSLDLSGVSIPKGDGYVILMTDVNNSSHIYIQGGKFSVTASSSSGKAGSGFAIASTTTILGNGPAGGAPTGPARLARHRRAN